MKSFSSCTAGDMRVAGINYDNVTARVTFSDLAVAAKEDANHRVFGCETGEAKVTFREISLVDNCQQVTGLAGIIAR